MRRAFSFLYVASGMLSGMCLVAIAGLILAQVMGRSLNVLIRGADDLVAWFTAATTFLGLPYAFWKGAHIRVELIIGNVPPAWRRAVEFIALVVALVITGSFAWASIEMVWESHQYGELSMGQLAVPMWIPQSALAIGASILFIAVIDATIQVILGRKQDHVRESSPSVTAASRLVES